MSDALFTGRFLRLRQVGKYAVAVCSVPDLQVSMKLVFEKKVFTFFYLLFGRTKKGFVSFVEDFFVHSRLARRMIALDELRLTNQNFVGRVRTEAKFANLRECVLYDLFLTIFVVCMGGNMNTEIDGLVSEILGQQFISLTLPQYQGVSRVLSRFYQIQIG